MGRYGLQIGLVKLAFALLEIILEVFHLLNCLFLLLAFSSIMLLFKLLIGFLELFQFLPQVVHSAASIIYLLRAFAFWLIDRYIIMDGKVCIWSSCTFIGTLLNTYLWSGIGKYILIELFIQWRWISHLFFYHLPKLIDRPICFILMFS